jgi:hypothetical protein
MVCDSAGRVQSVSANASREVIGCSTIRQTHFAEVFGQNSSLTQWLTEQVAKMGPGGDGWAEATLEYGPSLLHARVENLQCDGEMLGFVLTLVPPEARTGPERLREGDSVISRKEWHELKNHIGAIKLYATFLNRRLQDGDERQTVEKMLKGIDSLIDYLARIRRGETQ